MAYEEKTQADCNTCGKLTAHSRPVVGMSAGEHILNFLLLLCTGGCWLPIWILAIILHNSRPDPFRCTICGQAVGDLTAEQRHAMEVQKYREKQERHTEKMERRAENAAKNRAIWAMVKQEAAVAWTRVKKTPTAVDRGLAVISGEGNTIIHGALRVVVLVLCAVIPLVLGWLAIGAIF